MRNVLITGASSGIGRALAARYGAQGDHVILVARRQDLLEEAAKEVATAGGRATCKVLDVADTEQTVAYLRAIDAELNGLDVIIANAGVGQSMPAHKLTWEKALPVLQLNVLGAMATLTAVLPQMAKRGRGHLVGISSLAGIRGLPTSSVYSASKAALSTFLEGLTIDLQSRNIGVTDVRPGFVKTAITEGAKYPMPFLWTLEQAADVIHKGIEARKTVVAFPAPLSMALNASRLLPDSAYRAIVTSSLRGKRASKPLKDTSA